MTRQKQSPYGPLGRELLLRLREHQYCELRPSPIHGIGVFSIRAVPKGIDPLHSNFKDREIRIPKESVAGLPAGLRRLLKTFCYYDDTEFWVPSSGLNVVRLSIYLNHHKQPNLEMLKDGTFRTLRRIAPDEELTMDYDLSFEEVHHF